MLDKYSALTIGLTLITIGGLGLYETFADSPSIVESNQEVPLTLEAAGVGMPVLRAVRAPQEFILTSYKLLITGIGQACMSSCIKFLEVDPR